MTVWDRDWLWTRKPRPPYGCPLPTLPLRIKTSAGYYALLDVDERVFAQGRYETCAASKERYENHMAGLLTIKGLVGGPAAVLQAMLEDETVVNARVLNTQVAMTICKGIVEQRALDALRDMVRPEIQEAYDMYVLTNGEHADAADKDAWEEGIDDVVEKVLTPYEKCVTASWFGVAVTDTRLHVVVQEGDDEITALAVSFAKDAWRVLTNYMEDETLKVMSTSEILEAVGISRADVEDLLSSRPTPPELQQEQKEDKPMPTLNETLAKIKEFTDMAGMDEAAVTALLDNALDDDDGIAHSGLQQLGCDMEDRDPLQMFALAAAGDDVAEALYDIMQNGDGDEAVSTEAASPPPAPAAVPAGGSVPPPPPNTPKVENAGAPPPSRRGGGGGKRNAVAAAPTAGAIAPQAFQLIREHVKVKDEDLAALIGVSRQTFINYGKPTAKAQFVPDEMQRAALVKVIDDAIAGLTTARELVAAS